MVLAGRQVQILELEAQQVARRRTRILAMGRPNERLLDDTR